MCGPPFFRAERGAGASSWAGGTKVEEATVESRAIDENGKQLGSPHPHRLIRKGSGRWYVQDYAPRF